MKCTHVEVRGNGHQKVNGVYDCVYNRLKDPGQIIYIKKQQHDIVNATGKHAQITQESRKIAGFHHFYSRRITSAQLKLCHVNKFCRGYTHRHRGRPVQRAMRALTPTALRNVRVLPSVHVAYAFNSWTTSGCIQDTLLSHGKGRAFTEVTLNNRETIVGHTFKNMRVG